MSNLTYTVRIRNVEPRRDSNGKIISFRVTWRVAGRIWRKTFETRAQADAYRSGLVSASKAGEAFLVDKGIPLSWAPRSNEMTWYEFTLKYTDAKWPQLSPNSRRGIAEALTDATEVLLSSHEGPSIDDLRAALRWAYSTRIRDDAEPSSELAVSTSWLRANTVRLDAFSEPSSRSTLVRNVLHRISRTRRGTRAAANTANRKRMVLHNAMEYACEIGLLTDNPLKHVSWIRPRTVSGVDPRVVINPDQAHRFLAAVEADGERGPKLTGFFAVMYYAALRPEEATELRRSSLTLPEEDGQWGEMRLSDARPRSGSRWTNTGEIREQVPLKHRAEGEVRRVPIHPDLVRILKTHIERFGPQTPDGRLFVGLHGGPVTDRTYLRVFHRARAAALTPAEAASPLMEVPYALRHAAVSTWLRTTGDPALVARWAGHSVAVLLKVYAKCVDGAEQQSLERIWAATRRDPETPSPGNV